MRYVMLRLFTCCVAVLLLADVCIAQNRGRDEEHPVISRGTPQTSAGKTMAGIKGGASGKDLILELSLNVGTPDQPRRVPVSAAEAGAAKQGTLTITASVDCAVLVLQKDGKGVWQNAGGKKRLSLNAARLSRDSPRQSSLKAGARSLSTPFGTGPACWKSWSHAWHDRPRQIHWIHCWLKPCSRTLILNAPRMRRCLACFPTPRRPA
ncbi:MAG: hypothetical protein HC888_11090 [Candidatus Competibacteraceae bacterium]|nr:hypothetical protein [Candidatus Competibacteraceae bacterium]